VVRVNHSCVLSFFSMRIKSRTSSSSVSERELSVNSKKSMMMIDQLLRKVIFLSSYLHFSSTFTCNHQMWLFLELKSFVVKLNLWKCVYRDIFFLLSYHIAIASWINAAFLIGIIAFIDKDALSIGYFANSSTL
jgi:hypothetical protein